MVLAGAIIPATMRACCTPARSSFDMDGLMIDSEPLWWRVEKQLAGEHDREWSDELAMQCVGKGLPNVIVTMRRELGIPLETEEGVAWLVDTFIARLDELELKPGLLDLVARGSDAGIPMAVASSSTARLIESVLQRFDLGPRFTATVSGDSVENAKPAPDIFLKAADALRQSPEACVVLEDSLAGVQAAVAAGAPVIAVPELEPERFSSLTPHVVSDLTAASALMQL